jgi:hypothetical protein
MANDMQASYVKVDCETGFISMLGHWAVDDCGRLVNPLWWRSRCAAESCKASERFCLKSAPRARTPTC